MGATRTTRRLLRNHFLRRFLDNDLISPNTDRHEVLVLLAASLAVPGLFITVLLLGGKYVIGIPTPALTSVAALDDKFLYISASMLIMALMAAVQWDVLALDERDAAILGPLPVATREIGRAKLSALVIFVAAFAVMLNGVPSLIFPLLTWLAGAGAVFLLWRKDSTDFYRPPGKYDPAVDARVKPPSSLQ